MSFWKRLLGVKESVVFRREVRKQHPVDPNVTTVTKIYSAPSREAAADFLRCQKIRDGYHYIEVETPSGVFGKDKLGQYDSAGLLLQNAPSQSAISDWKSLSDTFHNAATEGDLDKVRVMLDDNSNLVFSRTGFSGPTVMFPGKPPLHAAARYGHKDVLELLLARGADVNAKNDYGASALHVAAWGGHKAVAESLIASGADVDVRETGNNRTPLHAAAEEGYKDVVELLLANKADVNAKDEVGCTPLDSATRNGHNDIVEMLRRHGGKATPEKIKIVKNARGSFEFKSRDEIVAAFKAGKVGADDSVWVDGVALYRVKDIL